MAWLGPTRASVSCFGLLLALFFLLISRNVSSEPYVYDEADYMYAASLGFAANWSDTPSIAVGDFVRAGLERNGRQSLSERIRSGSDVLFYRHFHGPLFYYLLIPLAGRNEHLVRMALLAIPAVSLAVVYFGCLWIMPSAALLAAVLFLTSYSVIGSTEVAPHQLFALCSLASLTLLLKATASSGRGSESARYWYGAVIAAGLAFCTLEIALLLLVTLAICCFVERDRWRVDRRFLAKSLALFLATVLLVWPAAILRLSFLKAYLVVAYLSMLRAPWGHAGFVEIWRARIIASPLEWILILVGMVMWFRNRRRNIYPLGVFAVLALAATVRVLSGSPRYSLPFMPVLDMLAGLALVPFLGPMRRPASLAVVALAVAGLYGSAWYRAAHQPHNPNPRSAAVVSYIHQNGLKNKIILAPQADLPTLHYYFPRMQLRGYYGPSPAASDRLGFAADAILRAGKGSLTPSKP